MLLFNSGTIQAHFYSYFPCFKPLMLLFFTSFIDLIAGADGIYHLCVQQPTPRISGEQVNLGTRFLPWIFRHAAHHD